MKYFWLKTRNGFQKSSWKKQCHLDLTVCSALWVVVLISSWNWWCHNGLNDTVMGLVCSDTGRKVDDPELLEAIRLTIINNMLEYHPVIPFKHLSLFEISGRALSLRCLSLVRFLNLLNWWSRNRAPS